MVNDKKGCKGCSMLEVMDICVFNPMYKNRSECPCQICLIKSMCKSSCEEFDKVHYKGSIEGKNGQ